MKKNSTLSSIVLFILSLVIFSCQEDKDIPKPVIKQGSSDYSIYTDETIKIEPTVTFEGNVNFQWVENYKELSKKPFLNYNSTEVGEHKITFTAVNKGGVSETQYTVSVKTIPLAQINIENGKEQITLKNGEIINFSPIITSIRECKYTWEENEKTLSTTKDFSYSSDKAGVHKLIFKATSIAGVSTDTININVSPIPAPIITIEIPKEGLFAKVNNPFSIAPIIESLKETSIQWNNGEKVISNEKTLNYTFTEVGSYDITLKVTNEVGTTSRQIKINVSHDFTNGSFVLNEGNMSNETGIVSFIYNNGVKIDSVYQKANNGETLGNVTQDMWIANNNIYFVSQNGPEHLIIADKSTLKKKAVILKSNSGLDWPTHIVVANENNAYIRDNHGLHIIDLTTLSIKKTIENVAANKQKMELINNKVIVAAKDELVIINPSSNQVEKRIKTDNTISGITEGKDKCIWISTNSNTIYKIETTNFSIENKYTIPKEFSLKAGWIPSNGLAASSKRDIVYWRNGGYNNAKLYKFDSNTNTTITLVDFAKYYTDAKIAYGDVAVDPITDNITLGVIKGFGMDYLINGLYIINNNDGSLNKAYKNCVRFPTCVYYTENFK